MSALLDNLKVKTQYVLPKKLLSRLIGKLASAEMGQMTTYLIKSFIKYYHVDMSEAAIQKIEKYKTFNEFFTRALNKNARPIAEGNNILTSPADGVVSEFGDIYKDAVIQAKGHYYSLEALVGGDSADAEKFNDGSFITTYLSPSNYHRVHMPFDGKLEKMIFVPGELFSVNPLTAKNVDNLFARNERVICFFKNNTIGEFAVVLVGATIVASIETVFAGVVAPSAGKEKNIYHYEKDKIVLKKGAELGKFLLGSTVICLFPKDKITFISAMAKENPVKMGQAFAEIRKN